MSKGKGTGQTKESMRSNSFLSQTISEWRPLNRFNLWPLSINKDLPVSMTMREKRQTSTL